MGVFKKQLYAGTGRGYIYRSNDGKKWKQVAALKGNFPMKMERWTRFFIPFNGYLYTGFEQGPLYRSKDGLTWTQATLKVGDSYGARGVVLFNGELYVGMTKDGTIWKTKDGEVWQQAFKANNTVTIDSMAVAGKFLFASTGGYVFRTPDGQVWEEVGQTTPYVNEAMAGWRGNIYVGTLIQPVAFIYRADVTQNLTPR